MRILVRSVILSFAFASGAFAAIVGTGDQIAIAQGAGVDLLVWRDEGTGRLKARRFGTMGALDASGFDLALPPGGIPSVAWDGSGFLIATTGSNTLLTRIPITGGAAFTLSYASAPPTSWVTVASKKDGTSLLAWHAESSTWAAAITANGEATAARRLESVPSEPAKLVRDSSSYLLAWITECSFPVCPAETRAHLIRLDDLGMPIAPLRTFETGIGNLDLASWSFAEGSRALLTGSSEGAPSKTRLFSIEPGAGGARGAAIRFPEPLSAQSTSSGQVLIGLGARIDLSETGTPLSVNWSPSADGSRLAGILPSSGLRVTVDVDGPGPISVDAPAALISEIGLTSVTIRTSFVVLKIDNRGPEAPKLIDLWVTGRVRNFNTDRVGTIARFGGMSRIRFDTTLHRGAGYEVALYFEEPVDTSAFEAWALSLGTDRNATNNYVSTRAAPEPEPEPEPEPSRRRRVVSR